MSLYGMATPHSKRKEDLFLTFVLASLFVLSMFAVIPVSAQPVGVGVIVASVNQNGTPIYGYYALLCMPGTSSYGNGTNNCDSAPYNARISSGFTTVTFTNFGFPNGSTIGVEVENYGSCTFSHWSDGGASNFELTQAYNPPRTVTAFYNCAVANSSVTITSQNSGGYYITGYYTVLYNSKGSVVGTGFTQKTFTTTAGQRYSVRVSSYRNCIFSQWSDGVTNNPRAFTATSGALSFSAIYNCGTGSGSNVTINSVNQSDNPISGYYVVLYNSGGSVLGTGFTPKTFTTTSGQNYAIKASSYKSCTFNHWSNGATSNPMPFTATSSPQTFTAVYNCG